MQAPMHPPDSARNLKKLAKNSTEALKNSDFRLRRAETQHPGRCLPRGKQAAQRVARNAQIALRVPILWCFNTLEHFQLPAFQRELLHRLININRVVT